MKFEELGIIEPILKSINYSVPTEIQEKSIPLIIEGKDIIAQSATGSGKTFAFGVGIIQKIEKGKGLQALVLTPTRELAAQVAEDLVHYSRFRRLNVAEVYGGVSINPQMDAIRVSDIVVGTPGRILDHIDRRTINFSKISVLVLDEADRMLDMGFIDAVAEIVSKCPLNRQTLLFSATISSDILRLAGNYMKDPVRVNAVPIVDPSLLTQVYYDVADNMKFSVLVHLLKREKSSMSMVFCNTQRMTDFVAKNLRKQGIDAVAIHGGLTQARRTSTLKKFDTQGTSVLVCTDVASRGLDIKGVSHIYNYDIPRDSKDYTHRVGRTARAGESGMAINILSSRDHENFNQVLRHREHNIQRVDITEPIERVQVIRDPGSREGGFGNRGRSSQSSGWGQRSGQGRGRQSGSRPSFRR
ncbi:MAG: DEAD/DEAH box helicase [archaeon]